MHFPDWVFDQRDREFMAVAIAEAEAAALRGEVPVGAVIVTDGAIVARSGNRRVELADPSAHAEILVLREAGALRGDWRLDDCSLYVTLEPCPMCAAACRQARLRLVVWGALDPQLGACGSVLDLADDPRLGPPMAHRGGLKADRSRTLLQRFFAKQRQKP
ncbi:MAG: nucleoside deaminase [Holophagae bacterium]|jgi:tRNA(adenine34) deaminase